MKHPLLPMNLKVYLINLDRAQERLQRMEAKCAAVGLFFERVSAVDGATLTFPCPEFDARGYKYLHGRRVIPAEVGCYLSHVECARRLLASDAEHALVLEDDVAFPPDFARLLQLALADATDWDILRLSSVNKGPKFGYRKLSDGRSLAIALSREKGAGAYIINRKAATWITRDLMPMRLSYDIAFDLEYLDGLRAAFIDPVPVDQRDEGKSQIQNGIKAFKYPKTRYLTVLPYRAWLETSRVAARLARYLHLSFRCEPRLALIRAAPTLAAIALGVDEIFDHM
ncbi:glycosyltransferase family 25 protein [Paracoccus actinidiae]|uniref:glycosyltransferase family 25 protein n=1 Tax=Paracoccus actinidiae TaxID=3064531 RepID=UPI0027D2CC5D|nr:glycosyltransferase family 25 protein [Paracoccus sp. M09]